MEYQRKLHDVFVGKSVAARARRAAFDVAADADKEIARLQAQLAAEQARHMETMDIATGALHGAIESLAASKAQVVELADALRELVTVVRGECPSLLNEDSGGSPELSFGVDDALAKAGR